MKSMSIAVLLVLSIGCMKKGADGAYHVTTTMDGSVKYESKKSNDQLKSDAKKLGRDLESKTSEAANKAGAALQRAGQKLKADSQKRH